jgi:hypothetical protein
MGIMARQGRLFIQVDCNWYDEWGCNVSPGAALVWILLVSLAKRLHTDGTVTLVQARHAIPVGMGTPEFHAALMELDACEVAPLSLVGVSETDSETVCTSIAPRIAPDIAPDKCTSKCTLCTSKCTLFLHGWAEWNTSGNAHENGVQGNHIRWHLRAGKADPTCTYCTGRDLVPTSIAPRSPPRSGDPIATRIAKEKSRVDIKEQRKKTKKESSAHPSPFAADFDEVWAEYPRKLNRGRALAAYVARRRAGVAHADLLAATRNYAKSVAGQELTFVKHAGTFFGPAEPFLDYVAGPPEQVSKPIYADPPAKGAGEMFDNEADREAFYRSVSLGKVELDDDALCASER